MFRVIGTVIREHDPGIAGLACLICLLAVGTAAKLLCSSPGQTSRERLVRRGAASVALSTGVWTTHFIGILAFIPGVPFGFNVPLCGASLFLAFAATGLTFALPLARTGPNGAVAIRGVLLAVGIMAMQRVSMQALLLPGRLSYNLASLAAAFGTGTLLMVAGLFLAARSQPGWSALMLTLGVLSVHFLGIGSVALITTPGLAIPSMVLPHPVLLAALTGACLLITGLAVGTASLDEHRNRRLAYEAQRFRALADATFEGLILEKDGRITDANHAMGALVGIDPAALPGLMLSDIMPGVRPADPSHTAELIMHRPDGESRPVEVLWRDDPVRGGHVIAIRDLSRQKAAESLIDRLARLDPVTGLLNRDALERQLQALLGASEKRPRPMAVLHIAISSLTALADLVGAGAVEQVRLQLADRLNAVAGQGDVVGQLSREDFAFLHSCGPQPAETTAVVEKILAEVMQVLASDNHPVSLSVSIGVALCPADGIGARDLLRHALLASRQAATEGRNRWRRFEPAMDERARVRQVLQRDLGHALDEAQFKLVYQPFYDAETLKVAGYEALLRWDHPERGRISPAEFIPAAEETGLIVPIGTWVLAAACAEAATWQRPATIAVNLSPIQFDHPALVSTVADVLHRTGLAAERLELEITETTLVADKQKALRIVNELKALGVRIAMDDFGTGYSSLSYLRTFPFDKLKIDRSFVSDIQDNAEAESIVQAIIALGASLRLRVTAEGVENRQQMAKLQRFGCNFLQGFLLGRPHNSPQAEARLERSFEVAALDPVPQPTAAPLLAVVPPL